MYAWIDSFRKAGKEYLPQEEVRKFFPAFYTQRLKSLRNHTQRFTAFGVVDSLKANNLPLE